MNKGTSIFAKAALDHLASPEQLDQLLTFGSNRLWLALFGLLAIVAAAVAWGFLGTVATDVSGSGVLLEAGGVAAVPSLGNGQIDRVLVVPGQHVNAGMLVAVLHQQQPTDELRAAQAAYTDLEHQLEQSRSIQDRQLAFDEASYSKRRAALEKEAANLESEASRLRKQQETERSLLAKGLITNQQLAATDQQLADVTASQAQNAGQMSSLESDRFRSANSGKAEDEELENQIDAAQRRVEELEHRFENISEVRSPVSGDVTEVSVRPGMVVQTGAPVVRLQTGGSGLYAAVYAPAEKAKQIMPGMEVQISPAGLKREEYGYLRGVVTRVSQFPVSGDELMERLSNESMERSLEASGPVNRVDVALQPNAAQPGTFLWSSPKGSSVPLSSGTMLSADVVVLQEHPVSLVIPFARKKLGWR